MADGLREALTERYTIGRELGRGGMAAVYVATDLRHDRPVALKVLHPEVAQALGPERFLGEVKLVARLQHPHILPVHDSGVVPASAVAPAIYWFTMPFVEGDTLRDRIEREGRLPVVVALRIAREVALALDYAHRNGIIHRDIKPENILLADEQAMVADFGLARAMARVVSPRLTTAGLVLGTPEYMSPEQAGGDPEIDGRSDVYSLGCVLYEMLMGVPPFTGPTAQAVVARQLAGTPRGMRAARENLTPELESAVMKALAKQPTDRFASAAEFARVLEELGPQVKEPRRGRARIGAPTRSRKSAALVLVAVLLLAAGVLVVRQFGRGQVEPAGARPRVLAVLPFDNLGRAEDDYFAEGVTDAVRGKLSALPGVRVIARGSSSAYRRTSKAPDRIARELGADYLLAGTVRWEKGPGAANRVQVSPELIQISGVRTPATLWHAPFDAVLSDVFEVQGEIARRVAQSLGVVLAPSERRLLTERPTTHLAAYDTYLRGEEISHGGGAGDPVALRRAARFYEQALALDSTFVLAWAQLSRAYSIIYTNGGPRPEDGERARQAVERALALGPLRPESHLALGNYHYFVTGDNPRALQAYAEGRRLAPNNAELLTATALAEQSLGRWESALGHLREARVLDPRSVLTARRLARVLLWLRRYPEALAASDHALALSPGNPDVLENKAMVYLARGDLAGARAVLRPASSADPEGLVAYVAYYWDLFWVLDDAQQRTLLRLTPKAFDDNRANWAICLAQTYALRGNSAKARAYADSARMDLEAQIDAAPG